MLTRLKLFAALLLAASTLGKAEATPDNIPSCDEAGARLCLESDPVRTFLLVTAQPREGGWREPVLSVVRWKESRCADLPKFRRCYRIGFLTEAAIASEKEKSKRRGKSPFLGKLDHPSSDKEAEFIHVMLQLSTVFGRLHVRPDVGECFLPLNRKGTRFKDGRVYVDCGTIWIEPVAAKP